MTLDARGATLARALLERPDSLEPWLELARHVERTGVADLGVPALPLLPFLTRHWGTRPGDRALLALFLAMVACRLPGGPVSHGAWWDHLRRRAGGGRDAFDSRTGYPLVLERVRDGARMRLVDRGAFRVSTGLQATRLPLPRRWLATGLYYLDESPLEARSLVDLRAARSSLVEGIRELVGRGLGIRALGGPARGTYAEALAVADVMGMALPTHEQWARPYTRGTLGGTRPGSVPHLDKEERRAAQAPWDARYGSINRLDSAFGIRKPGEGLLEWTTTRVRDVVPLLEEPQRARAGALPAGYHLVRTMERLDLAPDDGRAARQFRLALPLEPAP